MKKGGLEDTDQKAGDGQKEGGWVPFDTVPEDNRSQLHCKGMFPFNEELHHLIWRCHNNALPRSRACSPSNLTKTIDRKSVVFVRYVT